MKWMEAAWAEEGQAEVPGPAANPHIIQFFADVGLPGIKSDEVANCAAFVGACMKRAGLPLDAIAVEDRALARSYLKIGTPIEEPRVGCVFVMRRGNSSWEGHTGFVTAVHADGSFDDISGNSDATGSRTGGSVCRNRRAPDYAQAFLRIA